MKQLAITLLAGAMLSACATASDPAAMSAMSSAATSVDKSSKLYQSVSVGDVGGGKETNPLWTSQVSSDDFAAALTKTLSANAMLATDTGNYELKAQMASLSQPMIGLDMTVTAGITYTLTNVANGNVLYEKTVQTPYTATVGDAFVGATRLRLANEGAVKANLAQMLQEIKTKVDGSGTPMASLQTAG